MRSKLLLERGEKTFALVFDTGDEAMAGLVGFAKEQGLAASHFTGLGAFQRATLGYYDLDRKDYHQIPIEEQVEVLSLVGDITLDGDHPKVHAHVVVGRRDGTALGGHLLEAHVRPTLEVVVVETPAHLQRQFNPDVGLALIKL